MMFLERLFRRIRESRSSYVIADPRDNSVTFSRRLFKKLGIMKMDKAKVFVFRIPDTGHYAFAMNPVIDKPTQLADVMYNSKHRTIGFECLVPTVNRIFYDYRVNAFRPCRLSVRKNIFGGTECWVICKPMENAKQ